jgi:hypothetical protein
MLLVDSATACADPADVTSYAPSPLGAVFLDTQAPSLVRRHSPAHHKLPSFSLRLDQLIPISKRRAAQDSTEWTQKPQPFRLTETYHPAIQQALFQALFKQVNSNTIMEAGKTSRGWPQLPTELKLEILTQYLTFEEHIDIAKHSEILINTIGPIISTRNTELVRLALETYYNYNVFTVTICRLYKRPKTFGIDYPPPAYAPLIYNLHILGNVTFQFSEDLRLENALPNDLSWLFRASSESHETIPRPVESGSHQPSMPWHSCFTNLKELELELSIMYMDTWGHLESCPLCRLVPEACEQEYIAGLKDASIKIRAYKVQTRVTVYDSDPEDATRCPGHDSLERLITQMATTT